MNDLELLLLGPRSLLFLLNVAVALFVVSAVGLLLVRLCRRRSEPFRYGILFWTLMLALAAPALVLAADMAGVGWVQFQPVPERVNNAPHETLRVVEKESLPARPEKPPATKRAIPLPAPSDEKPKTMVFRVGDSSNAGAPVRTDEKRTQHDVIASEEISEDRTATTPWWLAAGNLFAVLWAAGSCFTLVLLARALIGLLRFRRDLKKHSSESVSRATARIAAQFGLSKPPPVFASPRTATPIVFGFVSPVIVLPDGFEAEVEPQQLDAVLLHEMAHIARGDHWAGLAQRLAHALYWWCPLIYALNRKLRQLREDICDNYVIHAQGDGSRLAELLVGLAERVLGMARLPASAGLFDTQKRDLAQRVKRLLSGRANTMVRNNFIGKLLLAVFGVFLGASALLISVRASEKETTPDRVASRGAAPGEVDQNDNVALAPPVAQKEAGERGTKDGKNQPANVPAELRDELSGIPMRQLMHTPKRGLSVAFSPDAKRLASASNDGTIRLWDIASGREICKFRAEEGDENTYYPIVFSHDGRTLASGGFRIMLWDLATGGRLVTFDDIDRPAHSLALSPDAKILAASDGDDTIYQFDTSTGKLQKRMRSPGGVVALHFSPLGKLVVASGDRYRAGSEVPKEDVLPVPARWDIQYRGSPYSADTSLHVHPISVPASDRVVFQLRQIDQKIRSFSGHRGKIAAVAISKDGRRFASADDKGRILVWLGERGNRPQKDDGQKNGGVFRIVPEEIIRLKHAVGRASIAFSPDGKILATVVGYRKIVLWDAAARKELRQIDAGARKAFRIAFSPDGKILASGGIGGDGAVRFWDPATGKLLRTLNGQNTGGVLSLAFSPAGKTFASAASNVVTLWDVRGQAKALRKFEGQGAVDSLAFSPDGKLLATVSGGLTVELWNVETGREVLRLNANPVRLFGSQAVAFSPNGKTLATAGEDKQIRFWDVRNGQLTHQLREDQVSYAVAWSPCSKFLLSGGGDSVRLWDLASGMQLRRWAGPATAVAFSPDGKTLAWGGMTGTTVVRLDIAGLLKKDARQQTRMVLYCDHGLRQPMQRIVNQFEARHATPVKVETELVTVYAT